MYAINHNRIVMGAARPIKNRPLTILWLMVLTLFLLRRERQSYPVYRGKLP